MEELLKGILGGAVSAWLLNKLWEVMTGGQKKLEFLLEKNIDQVRSLGETIVRHDERIKGLTEKMERFSRLPGDVSAAHEAIRKLRNKLEV